MTVGMCPSICLCLSGVRCRDAENNTQAQRGSLDSCLLRLLATPSRVSGLPLPDGRRKIAARALRAVGSPWEDIDVAGLSASFPVLGRTGRTPSGAGVVREDCTLEM
ncbi:hypothetical protein EXIGLDRAFT_447733 [Exidia glandulosa HHB12029]|uniref:Uncharacterized protein n=1 Tax=Exidia glandulosa HHB12029 TaxID=1314781 RepID=A0A165B5C1_EXIGL|nr:hypothetical protein EXIGLDRAFT_447733 [Exidia glandulosa HHB12029]